MDAMQDYQYKAACEHLNMVKTTIAGLPMSPQLQNMLNEAQARVTQFAPAQAALPQAIPESPGSTEQRLANIEQAISGIDQLVRQVAIPALDDAAQASVALLSAIGQSLMTPEQIEFVKAQQESKSAPIYFATQDARDAAEMFISGWMESAK